MADAIPASVAPEAPKDDPKAAKKADPKVPAKGEDARGVKLGNHEAFRKDN